MTRPPDHLLAYVAELQRRRGGVRFDPAKLCFGPQLAVLGSMAPRKVLCCGRRAGKTDVVEKKLLAVAKAGGHALYVTLTRQNAKELIWDELIALNEAQRLGGEINITELSIRFAGGGIVQLRGAHAEREIAKYRGKKFHLVVIDEMQSFPDRIVRPLLQSVIGPALIDFGGEMWLVGTKSPVRSGFWWECYAGPLRPGREQHAWDVRDNIMLPRRIAGVGIDDILREVRTEYGWTTADPTYRREYLNEDVEDLEALLYEWQPGRNEYEQLPTGDWSYLVGIDIGYDDSDAIAVLGWPRHSRDVYLVEEAVAAGQDVTDLAERASAILERYNPIRAVIDQGGLGKKIAVELQRRHGLALEAADKHRKPEYIKLMNADLRKGRIKSKHESAFAEDCRLVRKDPEALAKGDLRELPAAKGGYHSDICDAVLYAWRTAQAYLEQPAPTLKDEARAMREARIAEVVRRQRAMQADPDDFPGFGQD